WSGEEPDVIAGADLVRCYQRQAPDDRALCRELHTVLIDLRRPEGDLFRALHRTARYEVGRAAARDGLSYQTWDGRRDVLAAFCDFPQSAAGARGSARLTRRWLDLAAEQGALEISQVWQRPGEPLVWHAYYRVNGWATLLSSASRLWD